MPDARFAAPAEAETVATLLDAFNREFDTPTPGTAVLTERLTTLLAGEDVIALLSGEPAVAVALLTLRPNIWYAGPVALLDEMYVVPEMRGRGIGSTLLKAAEAVVGERGAEVVEINVDGDDTDARRFYERHGYSNTDQGRDDQMLYYFRELGDTTT
jgi:GNAT superfamily N-acetyltransferase